MNPEQEVSISDARRQFSALVHEAAVHGVTIYVTNYGRRVAVIAPLAAIAPRTTQDQDLR